MKGKGKDFCCVLIGGPPRKKMENHEKRNLCLKKVACVYEG